jgi:asparagine synthase (glutamine-hydrolysing)
LLKAMTDVLAHRGPDGDGHWSAPGCGLGHRRLSIIDLAGGAQPMPNADESVWVTYNGEIYNFQALRDALESRGHRFRTRSDTEVLVHLIGDRGAKAMSELRGMFALAAWDQRARQLILSRDRAGKKPLYWFEDRAGLYFASEIKALLVLPNCPREVDPASIDLYLAYEAIPGERTIFKGVHRLPPASTLLWNAGSPPRIETYWRADWQTKTSLSYDDAKVHLRELILDATKVRLVSDVPLGAFLSGGVDSSVVVAAMAQASSGPVRTFSIGFEESSFDETHHARTVAKLFGTEHEEFVVKPDAVTMLPKLAWHYDQPFGDSSALPTFCVSEMTRQRVTVALTGDGGDEFFGGYERYRALLAHAMYHSVTTPALRGLAARVTQLIPERAPSWSRILRRFPEAAQGTLDEFNLRLAYHRYFDSARRSALYTREFAETVGHGHAERVLVEAMIAHGSRGGDDPVDRALLSDTMMYLPDTLLVKVDIASMAVSLETRAPLLDTRVMEFAASLPRAWKVTAGQNKKILKDAYDGILPHDLLYRRKMGFSLPIAHWFRTDLYGYVRELLLDSRSIARGYFQRDAVESLIEEHKAGRNHALRLWALVMLEHWHREILEAPIVDRAVHLPVGT